MAEEFFFVLKLNLGRGSTTARVSVNLSWSPLIAYVYAERTINTGQCFYNNQVIKDLLPTSAYIR